MHYHCRSLIMAPQASAVLLLALLSVLISPLPARAQARDALVNGAAIGAASGAAVGVAYTYAVRDSDLTAGQYARGALVFAAIGAGIGIGVDALFTRATAAPAAAPRLWLTPAASRGLKGLFVRWRW